MNGNEQDRDHESKGRKKRRGPMRREEYERIRAMIRGGIGVQEAAGDRIRPYQRYRAKVRETEGEAAAPASRKPQVMRVSPIPAPPAVPAEPLTQERIQAMTAEAVRIAAAHAQIDPAWAKILFGYLRLLDPQLSERRGGCTPQAFAEEWERIRSKPRPPLMTWEEARGHAAEADAE